MKTVHQRSRSGLTRGEISVLIDAMEHYSGLDPNTFQIARLKESLSAMTEKDRSVKQGKRLADDHNRKN
jgi:hypothetical protein